MFWVAIRLNANGQSLRATGTHHTGAPTAHYGFEVLLSDEKTFH
jgi:hypothetical protein